MGVLDELAAADPLFAREVAGLDDEQRRWLEADLELRRRASRLAAELGRDESDIYHQLKHLRRSPLERLRLGLTLGRTRPRAPR